MEDRERIIKGTVFGDIIAAPFRCSGTSNRYFDLGQSRNAYYKGRAYTFHPQAGEPSFSSYAVCRWLASCRGDLTEDGLREEIKKIYESHPRAVWAPGTRDSILSPEEGRTLTPDWAPLVRVGPIAEYFREDGMEEMIHAVRTCVGATCRNDETAQASCAIAEALWRAQKGESLVDIRTRLESAYGFNFGRPLEDLSELLQGKVPEPIEMLGVPTGAFRYINKATPTEPSPSLVAEAALRCVFDSDGWEDAVRRAVALQGPVCATASVCGAFALSAGMDIPPSVLGKLSAIVPTEIERMVTESHTRRYSSGDAGKDSVGTGDIVDVVFTGFGPSSHTAYVVPPDRDDIMTALRLKFSGNTDGITILKPEEVDGYIDKGKSERDDTTHVIIPEPKAGFLYLQDGRLVSASEYVSSGMPPLQVRKTHRDVYRSLLSYTLSVQRQLNEHAGYYGEGQIHYEHAYHPVISRNRIDFYEGNLFSGAVCLDGRGLMKVIHGDLHDIGDNADSSEYKNAEWCRRTIFSRYDAMDPVGRVQSMKESIGRFVLDEGVGTERFLDGGTDRELFRVDYRKDDEDLQDSGQNPDIPNLEVAADDVASSEDPKILNAKRKTQFTAETRAVASSQRPSVSFSTTADSGYAQRTRDNASASDVTLAIAVDFSTRGESLTAQCAGCRDAEFLGGRANSGNPDKYVPSPWERDSKETADKVEALIRKNGLSSVPLRINIAGNGIYTFASHGISQEEVDKKALDILLEIQKRGIPVRAIRSGGQTGADEAGAKAGISLGIPTEIHAPRGYRYRDVRNRDICDEALFKRRFGIEVQEEAMEKDIGKVAPVQAVRTIFTIGHSNRTLSEFIATLQASMIDTVINVRSIGRSSYAPQFNNENLLATLAEYGISFFDAGETLGGRQLQEKVLEGHGFVNLKKIESSPLFDGTGRVDWDAVRRSDRFRQTVSAVTSMMEKGRMIALMCSEADPIECHRLGMIAREFSERGYEVLNILRNGRVESMEETESRLVDTYVNRGMIPDVGIFNDRREMAYRIQNRIKGWRPADMVRKKWTIKH